LKQNKTLFHSGAWRLFAYGFICGVMWLKLKKNSFLFSLKLQAASSSVLPILQTWAMSHPKIL